jgi:ribonuclease P/MRP protein subunit RPP40
LGDIRGDASSLSCRKVPVIAPSAPVAGPRVLADLNCLLLNARSLYSNLQDFRFLLAEDLYDLIFVTESWLTDVIPDNLLTLNSNYNIIRRDRGSKGGGLLVAVRNYLPIVVEPRHSDAELLIIDLLRENVRFLLGYLPNKYNRAEVCNICDGIRAHFSANSTNIIVGDFNMSFIDWKSHSATHPNGFLFLDAVSELGFTQLVEVPTRGQNILDLILADDDRVPYGITVIGNLGLSDHHMVAFKINNLRVRDEDKQSLRNQEVDFVALRVHLNAVDWAAALLASTTIEEMGTKFYGILYEAIRVSSAANSRPSTKCHTRFPAKLRTLNTKKLAAWRNYRANRTNENRTRYYSAQRAYSNSVRSYEIESEKAIIQENNLTSLYKFIKSRTGSARSIPPLRDNQTFADDNSSKAKVLSDIFIKNFIQDDGCVPFWSSPKSTITLPIPSITAEMVLNSLKGIKPSKACGPDRISAFLLKEIMYQICVPLSWVLEKSISSGRLFSVWKTAKISPDYKKGDASDPTNYRPIAITCAPCRVLERLLRQHMLEFLLSNEVISDDQFGFLPGRSTTTQLLVTLDRWTESVDAGVPCDILFIDFAKAFESVSHVRLLAKLDCLGFRGTLWSWIADFLLGRTQYVEIAGVCSDQARILSGVPQGSVLGPLLFVVYLNDLSSGSQPISLTKFADDVEVDAQIVDGATAAVFQVAINNIGVWSSEWQLPIAPSKSLLFHVGYHNLGYDYTLNDIRIPHLNAVKNLGVNLTTDLKFSTHCNLIVGKARKRAAMLRKFFKSGDPQVLAWAFRVYVRPMLEYAGQVWSPYHLGDIDRIESVQRAFTKSLRGLRDWPYSRRLAYLGLDLLELRRLRADLSLTYSILHGLTIIDPDKFFRRSLSARTRGHSFKLVADNSVLDCRRNFFSNRIVPTWNSLPESAVGAPSLASFKKQIYVLDMSRFLKRPVL